MINFIRTLLLVTYIKLVAQVFVMYVTIVKKKKNNNNNKKNIKNK